MLAKWSGQTLILIALGLVVVIIGIPMHDTVFRMDEWDYIDEHASLPFLDYLMKPNPAGQFTPLFKAIYALLVVPFNYSNLPLAIVAGAVRAATFAAWFAILRRCGCLSLASALIVLCVGLSYVGMVDVFRFPLGAAQEIALFCFTLALLGLVERRLVLCCGSLVAGSLCWGAGVISPITFLGALLLAVGKDVVGVRRRDAVALMVVVVVTGLAFSLIDRPAENPEAFSVAVSLFPILKYFFYGGIVNGALSGIAPLFLPGPVHALFFLCLFAGSIWLAFVERRLDRKLVILVLLLTQIALQAVIALTRWHHGPEHASSYRYVYLNVFLQLPLLAIVMHVVAERVGWRSGRWRHAELVIAVALLVVSAVGATKGRVDSEAFERGRRACLYEIIGGSNDRACTLSIYYRPDAEFVRRVWRKMGKTAELY